MPDSDLARTTPTVLTAWTATLLRALDDWGVDSAALAASCGIPASALDDPDRRVPLEATTRLWHAAAEAAADPCIGIGVSRYVRPGTFHALGQAVLVSPTLASALERVARYSRVTADVGVVEVEHTPDGLELTIGWRSDAPRPSYESMDAILSCLVRTARFMHDRSVVPTIVELERPEPSPSDAIRAFFRGHVAFHAPLNRIVFDHETATRPVPGGNAAIAQITDAVVEQYLAGLEQPSYAQDVRRALVELLPEGEPAVAAVAAALHVSARSLQRSLRAEGTSFSEVLTHVRRQLAQDYLQSGERSVTEVTYLLGFSETAAFSRAFKRWTGISPSQFASAHEHRR